MTQGARPSAAARAQVQLDLLNALDPVAPRPEQTLVLKQALLDRHFAVVSRAALLSGERLLHELIPDLQGAFARFVQDPVRRDPRCKAKNCLLYTSPSPRDRQ